MSQLIIIRGNSGAGKTTVSQLLATKLGNCAVICPDMFYHNILVGTSLNSDYKISVYQSVFLLATSYILDYGYNVIVEGLMASIDKLGYRDKYSQFAVLNNVNIHQFVLTTSFENALERNKVKKFISKEQQEKWYCDIMDSIDLTNESVVDVNNMTPQEGCDFIYKILMKK